MFKHVNAIVLNTFDVVGSHELGSNILKLDKFTADGIFLPVRFTNHGVLTDEQGNMVGRISPSPKGCVIQMIAPVTGSFQIEIFSDVEEARYLATRKSDPRSETPSKQVA